MTRFLTKSRFKLAVECPAKLYYTRKQAYPNVKLQDTFLQSLAEGGFQVGELAKCYFPGGIEIDELDHDIALTKTIDLLQKDNVIIYEAAFKFQNLFIRADIVVKKGKNLLLFEVKAKSYTTDERIMTRKGISSNWRPYIYDVAFQKYVIQNVYPDFKVKAHLMLADKDAIATVEGLNQRFFLTYENGRAKVIVEGDTSISALGEEILLKLPVDDVVDLLLVNNEFIDSIHQFAECYERDELIPTPVSSECKHCEFKATPEEEAEGLKSGFKECWKRHAGFTEDDFLKPSMLDIWFCTKTNEFIAQGRYFQSDISREDLEPKTSTPSNKPGLSRVDRQEIQITKAINNDSTPYIDIDGLREEMDSWAFPLHFIDFETTTVAIPFNAGRRPYEQIAFQFSHHIVNEDGSIKHQGQWLNTEQGKFPNFDFGRALKKELETDSGTIFRYAAHENSILNAIYRQLRDSNEPDRDSLCRWIQTITKSTGGSEEEWEGHRNMVDLCEIIKLFYYHPKTNGSNSIKYVLPAILSSSDYLKSKYAQPIYGSQIPSLNFKDKAWIKFDKDGNVISPYRQLEPLMSDIAPEEHEKLILREYGDIEDGGAAMMAYARMQFTQIGPEERKAIQKALLRYCELDTLSMVMIWEEWRSFV